MTNTFFDEQTLCKIGRAYLRKPSTQHHESSTRAVNRECKNLLNVVQRKQACDGPSESGCISRGTIGEGAVVTAGRIAITVKVVVANSDSLLGYDIPVRPGECPDAMKHSVETCWSPRMRRETEHFETACVAIATVFSVLATADECRKHSLYSIFHGCCHGNLESERQ